MKNKTVLIFAGIAIAGALAIYLLKDNWNGSLAFIAIVWGVYERYTKEIVKDEKQILSQENKTLREENTILARRK